MPLIAYPGFTLFSLLHGAKLQLVKRQLLRYLLSLVMPVVCHHWRRTIFTLMGEKALWLEAHIWFGLSLALWTEQAQISLKLGGEHSPVRSWGESRKNVVVVAALTLHSFDAFIARVLNEACLLFLRTRCNGLRTGSMSWFCHARTRWRAYAANCQRSFYFYINWPKRFTIDLLVWYLTHFDLR